MSCNNIDINKLAEKAATLLFSAPNLKVPQAMRAKLQFAAGGLNSIATPSRPTLQHNSNQTAMKWAMATATMWRATKRMMARAAWAMVTETKVAGKQRSQHGRW